jgi:WD40 repeat protein
MAYLPIAKLIATGHEDGSVYLWHFEVGISQKVEHHRFRHTNTVTCLSVYVDESREFLTSAGYDAGVLVWEIIKQKFTKDFDETKQVGIFHTPNLRGYLQTTSHPYHVDPERGIGDEIISTVIS